MIFNRSPYDPTTYLDSNFRPQNEDGLMTLAGDAGKPILIGSPSAFSERHHKPICDAVPDQALHVGSIGTAKESMCSFATREQAMVNRLEGLSTPFYRPDEMPLTLELAWNLASAPGPEQSLDFIGRS